MKSDSANVEFADFCRSREFEDRLSIHCFFELSKNRESDEMRMSGQLRPTVQHYPVSCN